MGATFTYLMLPSDPRDNGGRTDHAALEALDGYLGRHMLDVEPEEYLKANVDPENPPESIEPQVWRMYLEQAVHDLGFRKDAFIPDQPSLQELATEFNRTAEYVGETYRVEGNLIVGSSPINPNWRFNYFEVGGRFAEWFTEVPPDDWEQRTDPCQVCDGTGEIAPKSYILPRSFRLTAKARSAPDHPTPCEHCDAVGSFTRRIPPPAPHQYDLVLSPEALLKILGYGTEAAEPQSFVDLRGVWIDFSLIQIEGDDGVSYWTMDVGPLREALESAPPGTVVIPIEHDGG